MTKMPRDHHSPGYRNFVITADKCEWNAKVMLHGERLAIVLPREVVQALILREGSAVRISITDVLDAGIRFNPKRSIQIPTS